MSKIKVEEYMKRISEMNYMDPMYLGCSLGIQKVIMKYKYERTSESSGSAQKILIDTGYFNNHTVNSMLSDFYSQSIQRRGTYDLGHLIKAKNIEDIREVANICYYFLDLIRGYHKSSYYSESKITTALDTLYVRAVNEMNKADKKDPNKTYWPLFYVLYSAINESIFYKGIDRKYILKYMSVDKYITDKTIQSRTFFYRTYLPGDESYLYYNFLDELRFCRLYTPEGESQFRDKWDKNLNSMKDEKEKGWLRDAIDSMSFHSLEGVSKNQNAINMVQRAAVLREHDIEGVAPIFLYDYVGEATTLCIGFIRCTSDDVILGYFKDRLEEYRALVMRDDDREAYLDGEYVPIYEERIENSISEINIILDTLEFEFIIDDIEKEELFEEYTEGFYR